jgi:hypothetical protein
MTEKRIFDGVAVILEAVDFVATVEENEPIVPSNNL